jgi:lambda family phage holin
MPTDDREPDKMNDKDPQLWATLAQWASENAPAILAPALSFVIAGLRVIYGGGERRQVFLEAALCGLATVSIVPALEWLGLPQSMATFAGGMVGFVGVEKLRAYADKLIGLKVKGR